MPSTLTDLRTAATSLSVSAADLRDAAKWEPVLRGKLVPLWAGWTTLGALAISRRGIATGANSFFLVSRSRADRVGLRPANLTPSVGRARDVEGVILSPDDFDRLGNHDAKVWLLDLKTPPAAKEQAYIRQGEQEGLTSRFLLQDRKP